MSFSNSFKILMGILFGPDDLWESNDDIIKVFHFCQLVLGRTYLCLYWIRSLYNVWVEI